MVKVSAGSFDLNKFLHGGYEADVVTVLYGASATGKTNFCLLAAVSQAKKGNKVIFIDSEGGFSVERVKQLIGDSEVNVNDVLKNIFLFKPTNFIEQKESFRELSEHLKKDSNDEISLIIVDGMTILYRLDFADARESDGENGDRKTRGEMQKINSELARQIRTLAEVARKKEIPVLITNQVYRWENESNMVGGDILKYWGKCWIELVNDKGRRYAILKKHRSLPEKTLGFQIFNGGIRKKGWI